MTSASRFLCAAPAAISRDAYNSSAMEALNAGIDSRRAGDKAKTMSWYEKAPVQDPIHAADREIPKTMERKKPSRGCTAGY